MGMLMRNRKCYTGKVRDNRSQEIGEIKAFMRNTAPRGYLKCDGTTYNIADYPLLTDMFLTEFGSKNYFGGDGTTTFAVPDLRGEFLRGTGTNSHTNQGSGANVGTHQDGTKHVATQWGYNRPYIGINSSGEFLDPLNIDVSETSTGGYASIASGNATTGNARRYYTARPTNTSVLYCIRAY